MTNILADQLEKITDQVYLLDVRTSEEFSDGYINGATNLPVEDLIKGQIPDIKKDEKIVVYCESGARSHLACQILDKLGYQTYNLVGGYTAWINKKPS